MFRRWRRENCKDFRRDLSAYIDNRLDNARRASLEEHLGRCQACRAELESLRQTVSLLRLLPMEPPPRTFAIRGPEPVRRAAPVLALRIATSVAAVLLALVFAIDMSNVLETKPTSTVPAIVTTPSPEVSYTARLEGGNTVTVDVATQPAPTPSPVPKATEMASGLPAGRPAGPLGATKPSPTSQPEATPIPERPLVAGVPTPIPTPAPTPTSSPVPMPAPSPTAIAAAESQGNWAVPEPRVPSVAEAGAELGALETRPAAETAGTELPLRPLEWALLAATLALAVSLVVAGRRAHRKASTKGRY